MTASDTAISAGWAFSVSVRVSFGPSNMICGELLAQRRIDLLEHVARGGVKLSASSRAHADVLAALAGENECDGHEDRSARCLSFEARTPDINRCQALWAQDAGPAWAPALPP